VVHEVLRYLRVQLPAVFVLENVQGFMTIKGGAVLKWLLRELRGLGGQAYDVSYRLLNSEDHGRPQHRKRLFILGTLKSCLKNLAVACRSRAWPRLTGHGRKMLAQVRAKAAKAGLDINTDLVVADVYGSRPHYMVNRMPTITRTRGAQGGFLITRARRFTTAAELLALQGFPVHALDLRGIPERQQGMLAGNAITVHVLARILARALPAVKLARGLRDPCTNEVF
jgi:site-specific DNA-cytosine methylase